MDELGLTRLLIVSILNRSIWPSIALWTPLLCTQGLRFDSPYPNITCIKKLKKKKGKKKRTHNLLHPKKQINAGKIRSALTLLY